MSDSVCGPSSALKSFSEHANRDRSLHQDRPNAGVGQAGPSNFRSAPVHAASSEAQAQARAFVAGAAPVLRPEALPVLPEHHLHGAPAHVVPGPGPVPGFAPGLAPGLSHGPVPPFTSGFAPQAQHASSARATGSAWAAEFASSSASASTGSAPSLARPLVQQQPFQAVHRLNHFAMGMDPAGPSFLPPAFQQPVSFPAAPLSAEPALPVSAMAAPRHLANPSAPSGVAGLTEAELEARFAAVESQVDFEGEMDQWMAVHGPAAEARAAAEAEQIDTVLESLAEELEAQQLSQQQPLDQHQLNRDEVAALAEDAAAADAAVEPTDSVDQERERERDRALEADALARTAGQIVSTLDAHPSARFHESSFMRLMRRIQDREVTVRGDNLIDEATGQPVEVVVDTPSAKADNHEADQPPQPQEQLQ